MRDDCLETLGELVFSEAVDIPGDEARAQSTDGCGQETGERWSDAADRARNGGDEARWYRYGWGGGRACARQMRQSQEREGERDAG